MTRLESLLHVFGMQGGTIHQIAKLTGCTVNDLLDSDVPIDYQGVQSDYAEGWFMARLHPEEFKYRTPQGGKMVISMQYGNTPFWIGVAEGTADLRHFIE